MITIETFIKRTMPLKNMRPQDNTQPEKESLYKKLTSDKLQQVAGVWAVIMVPTGVYGLVTAIRSPDYVDRLFDGLNSGLCATLGALGLAYTIDNIVSYYQGRGRTHLEDIARRQWDKMGKLPDVSTIYPSIDSDKMEDE